MKGLTMEKMDYIQGNENIGFSLAVIINDILKHNFIFRLEAYKLIQEWFRL